MFMVRYFQNAIKCPLYQLHKTIQFMAGMITTLILAPFSMMFAALMVILAGGIKEYFDCMRGDSVESNAVDIAITIAGGLLGLLVHYITGLLV